MAHIRMTFQRFVVIMTMLGMLLLVAVDVPIMLAIQAGKSTLAAIISVTGNVSFWLYLMMFAFTAVIFFLITYALVLRKQTHAVTGKRYQILRWVVTPGGILMLITGSIQLIHALQTGTWSFIEWINLFSMIVWLIILYSYWFVRPSPERLEAIETGDYSRLLDERTQLVNGKGAHATLMIFLLFLFILGPLYDILVTHQWPVRTFIEIVLLAVIQTVSLTWWNRKL